MAQRHVIELALDFVRMPTLARSSVAPPIPPNVIEFMRIAAASPNACKDAAVATGASEAALIEAARFYLQLSLFRPDADSYRILGIEPGTPRETARSHMRWLLQWLHPDRNSGLEAVFAGRVLKAWHEVSNSNDSVRRPDRLKAMSANRHNGTPVSVRLPWIRLSAEKPFLPTRSNYRIWAVPTGLVVLFLALWLAGHLFAAD